MLGEEGAGGLGGGGGVGCVKGKRSWRSVGRGRRCRLC